MKKTPGVISQRTAAEDRRVSTRQKTPGVTNALSFDIEDWFHMVDIDAVSNPRKWPDLESLVERYTEWIVQAVTEAGVRATFFVLGWIAVCHFMTSH